MNRLRCLIHGHDEQIVGARHDHNYVALMTCCERCGSFDELVIDRDDSAMCRMWEILTGEFG